MVKKYLRFADINHGCRRHPTDLTAEITEAILNVIGGRDQSLIHASGCRDQSLTHHLQMASRRRQVLMKG